MSQILGLIILSFFISFILLIPFIDFLYKIKMKRQKQSTRDIFDKRTPIFDKLNSWKAGTPFGGGILIVVVTSILTLWAYGLFSIEIDPWKTFVLLFSFIGFGLLGLYDDAKKLVSGKKAFFGLRFRHKVLIQVLLACIISFIFVKFLGFDFVNIRGIGALDIGPLYFVFAAFVIISFVNAFNITDGLDGLAAGLFLICMSAFLVITQGISGLDKSLGVFIAILMGCVGAFLYFNIFRARLWLGDTGSMALGAALAVTGLLTGKIPALAIIGGVFVLEVGSSLIQILSKKFLHKKLYAASPLHLYLQYRGWEEPKVVMRAWLLGFFFAIVGLYIAFIR